jgi:hypothetical protein
MISVATAAAALAALTASTADAGASGAFLCYSKWQVDPGFWHFHAQTTLRNITAQGLFNAGYWSPYAEKTIPTKTHLPNGYYLICNLGAPAIVPPTTTPQVVPGAFVDSGTGTYITSGQPASGQVAITTTQVGAGLYPVAQ